ncbi:MAG: thiamine pyrophosphate-binding protein [Chloroflexi bacterium]|nr:thiamine pyrophosphate-binding protein [Chloroflexota bacterium]
MKRFECLAAVGPLVTDEIVLSTAGGATLEWQAYGPAGGHLQVKTLGLGSSIGLGLALALPERKVIVLDGDGALLMNLCSLPTIARQRPPNLIHCVFDNGVYEASGGTVTHTPYGADLAGVARAVGIENCYTVNTVEDFKARFEGALRGDILTFICAKVEPGREPVPPLEVDEVENKYRLIRFVEKTAGRRILVKALPASFKGK